MAVGTLIVSPKSAQLTYKTGILGKMDPFIKISIANQNFSSSVAKNQGKTPVWSDKFNFKILNDNMLTFSIYDHDKLSRNDFIAEGSCALANVLQGGKKVTEYATCMRNGKSAGQVVFELEFIPDASNKVPSAKQEKAPQQQLTPQIPKQPQCQQPYPNQQPCYQQPYPNQQPFCQQPYPNQQPCYQQPYYQQPQPVYVQQPYCQQPYPSQQYPQTINNQPAIKNNQQQANKVQHSGPQYNGHSLPIIRFRLICQKCHGDGWRNKDGKQVPCSKCYENAGYCKKCCGTKYTIKENKKCEKC
ncbi:hypothetical protein ABPG74_019463 [Tetrahymena malaccensis]